STRRGRILLDKSAAIAHTREAMGSLGTELDPNTLVSDLSVAEQQLVSIAKALSQNAAVLILDEPTAMLSPKEVDVLFRLLRDIQARGVGILYVSHHLQEAWRIGDRLTVFRDGRSVVTTPVDS